MLRYVFAAILTLAALAAGTSLAILYRPVQAPPDDSDPDRAGLPFGKGNVGDFRNGADAWHPIEVVRVVDGRTLRCRVGSTDFLMRGVRTDNLVDGSRFEMHGRWRCVGTTSHNGRTIWVIEPK